MRFLAHLDRCECAMARQIKKKGGLWVPMSSGFIERQIGGPHRTKDLWDPLVDAGVIVYKPYRRPKVNEDGCVGQCRRFAFTSRARRLLLDAGEKDRQSSTNTWYDATAGRISQAVPKTRLTYDGTHSWKHKSPLIYQVLKHWKTARTLINVSTTRAYLNRESKKVHKMVENGEKGAERALARFQQANWVWSQVRLQGPEPASGQPDGVCEITAPYTVQDLTGRISTPLQNAPSGMKKALYSGIRGLRNYDIKSSQTTRLRQFIREDAKAGAPLDPNVFDNYPGKDAIGTLYDIPRDLLKPPEHAVKFGARFVYASMENAFKAGLYPAFRSRFGQMSATSTLSDGRHVSNSDLCGWLLDEVSAPSDPVLAQCLTALRDSLREQMPALCAAAMDIADTTSHDDEAADQILRDTYGPMVEQIDQWTEWRLTEYWETHSRSGGSTEEGGLRTVIDNPCGLPFSREDYSEADRKKKFAASFLQGGEAAFIHHLTLLSPEYGYEPIGNEHDGLITLGEIPSEAVEEARRRSKFWDAEIVEKPF
jgi:hypothetical protein